MTDLFEEFLDSGGTFTLDDSPVSYSDDLGGALYRHMGPGPHPSGSEQQAHAGDGETLSLQQERSNAKTDYFSASLEAEEYDANNRDLFLNERERYLEEYNEIHNRRRAAYKRWMKTDAKLDEVDPGWRSRGFTMNRDVKISKISRVDNGFHIRLNGKKVGHIAGVDGFRKTEDGKYLDVLKTKNTKLIDDARGQRAYQTALARVALKYEGGTVSQKFQMSAMVQQAIQKIPGIQWHGQKGLDTGLSESWLLTKEAASDFLNGIN